jgi:cytochrome c biogenesis protein CcmG/thiol:disulfide interchange protein DsbE
VRTALFCLAAFSLAIPLPSLAAQTAPAFTLKLLDGKTFDSRSLIGKKALVIRFQASWSRLSVQSAPAFERSYRKYRNRGVEFVGVQVQDEPGNARRFLKAHQASYPAGLDPDLRIANRFSFERTPYTVVISKRGEIVARRSGIMSEGELATLIDPLLKPSAKKPPTR